MAIYLLPMVIGYLLGALPFGVIVARLHGVSLLRVGSGSTGATNVSRSVGGWSGKIVFLLDAGKGCLAAILSGSIGDGPFRHMAMVGVLAALLGHSFSCFLKFRGGKGVAVTVGGLAVTMPNVLCMGGLTWVVVFLCTRFVSLASLCLALVLPLCSYLFGYDHWMNWASVLLCFFIILRHTANIRRLFSGKEYAFDRKG
jgi:glycerol-3-phosphate acyltransferase PlsY